MRVQACVVVLSVRRAHVLEARTWQAALAVSHGLLAAVCVPSVRRRWFNRSPERVGFGGSEGLLLHHHNLKVHSSIAPEERYFTFGYVCESYHISIIRISARFS